MPVGRSTRRAFIAALGGAAAWPVVARTQQSERVRQIAVLSEFSEAQMQPLVQAFRDQLQSQGWKPDALRIDLRFAIEDAAQFKETAAAIVGTHPDLIVALGSRTLRALKDETRTIPIVFTLVADPVAQGLVKSLARPDGNFTGLTNYDSRAPSGRVSIPLVHPRRWTAVLGVGFRRRLPAGCRLRRPFAEGRKAFGPGRSRHPTSSTCRSI
jgi:hypothetical protein